MGGILTHQSFVSTIIFYVAKLHAMITLKLS